MAAKKRRIRNHNLPRVPLPFEEVISDVLKVKPERKGKIKPRLHIPKTNP